MMKDNVLKVNYDSFSIDFDRELIEKCQINAPRYTSYPTADRFNTVYDLKTHLLQIKSNLQNTSTEISLYIHIPFCNTLCLYCACNKIITNDRNKIIKYLKYLEDEVKLYYNLIGKKLNVVQLHFGGGSPSWLSIDEVNQIMDFLRSYFNFADAQEVSMEIDPRHTTREFMLALKNNGFNRISIGLQDFDPKVQKVVNRIQSYSDSKMILDCAKELGFKSTNIDLIYGLPLQTVAGFTKTIDTIIEMRPERIALFNYAHLPHIFMPQKRINENDLPKAGDKLDILQMSVAKLSNAGYEFIGMDHFALRDDSLTIALKNKTLQRNFQGYSTFANSNMLALGVSSIGMVNNSYYQNEKILDEYYKRLDNLEFPIIRGVVLSLDDIIRKHIIQEIMCQFSLSFNKIEQKFSLKFIEYFSYELEKLKYLGELGLVSFTKNGLEVTAKGRFLIRNVAVIFDKHIQEDIKQKNISVKRYSKVI